MGDTPPIDGQQNAAPQPTEKRHRLLEAERLYKLGQVKDLLDASSDVEAVEVNDSDLARLQIVRAMAQFDVGDVTAAIGRLESLAENKAGGIQARFEASLALFLRSSDFGAPSDLLSSLTALRQLATMSGNARSLAALHLAVARLEGLRGLFGKANHHLRLSRRLSSLVDDEALACTLDLVEGSLECIGGNLSRAMALARSCGRLAQSAGFSKYVLGSATNLASIELYMGERDRAKRRLDKIISEASNLTYVKFGALDTLTQLAIFDRSLVLAERSIKECQAVLRADKLPARSWYDFAHQITRCTYHEHLRDWRAIVEIVDGVDAELVRRQYRAIRTTLLCVKARALAHLGSHGDAQATLTQAVKTCPRSAADPLIVLEASKAVCAELQGDAGAASAHFDRAIAGCRAIGHRYHERWISAARDDLARPKTVPVPQHRDMDVTDAALLLTDAGTILGAGHSIDLMAHRLVSLLQSTTLRPHVDVESQGDCEFQPEPSASWESMADGSFRIRLRGSDRTIDVRVRHVSTIEEISLLKSLVDIVQAGVNRTADTEHDEDDENLWPQAVVSEDEDAIFRSPRMIELRKIAVRLASTELPVLITGETGTGKEIFARLIHDNSKHRKGPFIPFNCSTVPRDLVESQLFGHRRGAFTGAHDSFPGLIRAAEKGTLFLDEVGDLELSAQPKLLRFLESGEIQPLGDLRPQRVSMRLVAATNANMEQLVRQGLFRRDLLYRLGVSVLVLPPLRERKDEIPALASFFLAKSARECGRSGVRLADDFVAALLLHDWPGNIRELANEIRRAVALADDGDVLDASHLAPEIAQAWQTRPAPRTAAPVAPGIHVRFDQTLTQAVSDLEERFIEHALQATGGRVSEAAQLLGLSRKGLFLKRRRRGLVSTQTTDVRAQN